MSPYQRGDQICAQLKALGQKPVWMDATDNQIAIGFELISEHPSWTKATHADAVFSTPGVFIELMNEWRAKVRADIALNMPSSIVKHMIASHGMAKVMKVLEPV